MIDDWMAVYSYWPVLDDIKPAVTPAPLPADNQAVDELATGMAGLAVSAAPAKSAAKKPTLRYILQYNTIQ